MKNFFIKLKWILSQTKGSAFSLTLIIIFSGTVSLCNVYRAIVTKQLIDSATDKQFNLMTFSFIILAVLILGDVAIRAASSALSTRCYIKISNSIQKKFYSRLMRTSWYDYSKYHSGDILTRMTTDIDAITNLLVNQLPSIIELSIMLIASFITLLFYDKTLPILILIISPFPLLLSRIFSKKLKKIYLKIQELESTYRSFLNESIQNIIVIKSFCLEDISTKKFSDMQKSKLNLSLKRNNMSVFTNSTLYLGYCIGTLITFSIGSMNIYKGIATLGTLTAMLQLVASIQSPFSRIASSLPEMIYAIASSERILDFEKLSLDSIKPIDIDLNSAGIKFDNVSFSYDKNLPVIKDASTNINPGEIIALVGPSGQGKTTLIRLVLSLLNPESGHIFIIANNNEYEVSALSRRLISYVPQGNTLFSGTIADNLRCGYSEATDEDIKEATKVACAWDFIKDLPNGIYTEVGERGVGLSEGQAQRIAIARALIHKSPILIFDEATSALDIETETKIIKTIQSLHNKRTCIIITHRPTALRICQRIFKIDNCHLVEIEKN
ncbi:ABC transporter ATP-binding protein [Clostridium sp. JS66]|uniref:ABC transporter ATP-binding protein n=1 Tax=Clostridium sp. JS66 TaxID=3064705 RepID=UPI00298E730D|nr:ABC transporter ATP-binding protein [Clostridium sp. JS66]WPC43297.1 ABC transporter ATP-binding protein [Clostridium sp. JS66]